MAPTASSTHRPMPHHPWVGTPVTTRLGDRLAALLRNAGLRIVSFLYRAKRQKNRPEPRKVVLRKDRLTVLLRSWVHILPSLGTIALAVVHWKGYFIGSNFEGLVDPVYQTFDSLLLQIAAKCMELLVVASIGNVIFDILRDLLLFRKEGLPLGLLGAHTGLAETSYLWSPGFYSGCQGFKSRWLRGLFGFLLVLGGIIAVLVGPASALLMIPAVRNAWPAGGAWFWLKGSPTTLWPETLDANSVGGAQCFSPSSSLLTSYSLNTSDCIWGGYTELAQLFKSQHLNDLDDSLTIEDGATLREHTLTNPDKSESNETWVLGTSAAIDLASTNVADAWASAVYHYDQRGAQISRRNLGRRLLVGTTSSVVCSVPAARVSCAMHSNISMDLNNALTYPYLPAYAVNDHKTGYLLNSSNGRSQHVTTRCVKPTKDSDLTLSNGSVVQYAPGAFLNVQIPYPESTSLGVMFPCAVDARWAPGNITTKYVGVSGTTPSQFGSITHHRYDPEYAGEYPFLPVDDGSWITTDLTLDWLNALTPSLDLGESPVLGGGMSNSDSTATNGSQSTTSNRTTLAEIIHGTGSDNSTGELFGAIVSEGYDGIHDTLETIIAALVVDGMSRVGYSNNGGLSSHFTDPWHFRNVPKTNTNFEDIINGDAELALASTGDSNSTSSLTRLYCSVTFAGYSYKADNASFYLAFVLLFLHLLIALLHTTYKFWTGISSDAWSSVTELLVLAQQSAPAKQALYNVSAGIERGKTLQNPVRIRAVTNDAEPRRRPGEEVQMLFEEGCWDEAEAGFERIAVDRAYGLDRSP